MLLIPPFGPIRPLLFLALLLTCGTAFATSGHCPQNENLYCAAVINTQCFNLFGANYTVNVQLNYDSGLDRDNMPTTLWEPGSEFVCSGTCNGVTVAGFSCFMPGNEPAIAAVNRTLGEFANKIPLGTPVTHAGRCPIDPQAACLRDATNICGVGRLVQRMTAIPISQGWACAIRCRTGEIRVWTCDSIPPDETAVVARMP